MAHRVSSGYRGVSVEAARRHYDISDDFFRLWLGPSLAYSCALWAPGDTLESAQSRKVDYVVEQSGLRPKQRLLDIGCGYGTEMTALAARHDVEAIGLTLSERQATWLQEQRLPGVTARLENWVDHRPPAPYDVILSFEAFEHFARPGMSRTQKIRAYRRFFEACRAMISPSGSMVLQTITWGHRFPWDATFLEDLKLATHVYPECNPSFLGEIVSACDGLFDLKVLRNDHDHYTRTTAAWVDNLESEWDRAVALVGEQGASNFRRCMRAASRAFDQGWLYLLRLTLRPVRVPSGPAHQFLVNNALGRVPGLR